MENIFIGIDNGVTGSIGLITKNEVLFFPVPIFRSKDYQITKNCFLNRIDVIAYKQLLCKYINKKCCIKVLIERPMVNSTKFVATKSSLRCLEATLIVFDLLKFEQYQIEIGYTDSKIWQKALYINGFSSDKKISLDLGLQLYPCLQQQLKKHKDADGILIAHYLRRKWENEKII